MVLLSHPFFGITFGEFRNFVVNPSVVGLRLLNWEARAVILIVIGPLIHKVAQKRVARDCSYKIPG